MEDEKIYNDDGTEFNPFENGGYFNDDGTKFKGHIKYLGTN